MLTRLDDLGPDRGIFVVLEGLDGSGTTTQAELLASWLRDHGTTTELTYEPSGGPIGEVTRSMIDGRTATEPAALALLFAADRAEHLHGDGRIISMLERGVSVICDRYVLSSLAYQSAQGLSTDWLTSINAMAVPPDVSIFIDTDVPVCLQRISQRGESNELFHDGAKLTLIDAAYREALARGAFVGSLVTADGNQDRTVVAKQIRAGMTELAEQQADSALGRLWRPLAGQLPLFPR